RALHHDIFVNLRQFAPLPQHALGIQRNHLGADGSIHDVANRRDLFFYWLSFFGDQTGVRGYAVKDAPFGGGAYFFKIGAVDEKFHGISSISALGRSASAATLNP